MFFAGDTCVVLYQLSHEALILECRYSTDRKLEPSIILFPTYQGIRSSACKETERYVEISEQVFSVITSERKTNEELIRHLIIRNNQCLCLPFGNFRTLTSFAVALISVITSTNKRAFGVLAVCFSSTVMRISHTFIYI